jgi:S1-C subfamily serine protease
VLGDVPDLLREHLSLPVHALVIESVKPDSAARSAGIRAKDLLLEVDGKPAKSFDSVRETLKDSESKLEVSVKILRQGKEQTLSVRWPESK